jgi:DNA-binding response OmpR family regulator
MPAEEAPAPSPVAAAKPERTYQALVVDDEFAVRHLVRAMIERGQLGLTVLTAQDGHEALTLAELERPDVVITDLTMPDMDGLEFCRRLRAQPATAHVPVLVLSGVEDEEMMARAFGAGADDYVVKPFRREELAARIKRMIERAYGREASNPPAAPPADGGPTVGE